jgi:hypothetical protein
MRKTIVAFGLSVVTSMMVMVAVVGAGAAPAGALSGPVQVTRITQLCANQHTPPVNVTATYRLHIQGDDRWGGVTLKGSNGNSVHYQLFFQQYLNREIGTEVVPGDPLFPGTWYYIVGVVEQSTGGYIIDVPTGATDLCQVLGADNA